MFEQSKARDSKSSSLTKLVYTETFYAVYTHLSPLSKVETFPVLASHIVISVVLSQIMARVSPSLSQPRLVHGLEKNQKKYTIQ